MFLWAVTLLLVSFGLFYLVKMCLAQGGIDVNDPITYGPSKVIRSDEDPWSYWSEIVVLSLSGVVALVYSGITFRRAMRKHSSAP